MNEWSSYQLQDFIPFTADVYFRLLERMGETFWPLHLVTLAMGAATLVLALKHRTRLACLLPAPLWAFVAFVFFIQRYAELNWAGGYVGYAFIAQAVLLVVIALAGWGVDNAPRATNPPVVIGTAISLFGLIIMPMIAPLSGGSWYQAEVFGIHADPTAVTTLGLVLIMLRGFALWIAAIIPALWLVASGRTLQVLDSTGAVVLFAVLVIALVGVVWKSIEAKRRHCSGIVNLATYLEVLICTKTSLGGSMATRPKRNFSPEFRLEAAQLVVDQHYTVREAAEAMNVGYSSMDKWVRQLRQERDGQSPKATPMTPDQLRIRELEKRIRDIEMEKDILKNRYGLAPACRYRNPTASYTQLGCQGRSRWLFGGRPR